MRFPVRLPRATRWLCAPALALLVAWSDSRAQAGVREMDVLASDGVRLPATYWSPGKPGPGILLLHQCDMTRRAWTELGAALAARGVHVLTFDYRGYGDSPAGARERLDPDIDAALATLVASDGVDSTRLAAGGASCGVRNAVELARRSGRIDALLLLSGPTPDAGLAWLRAHATTPIFAAASATEDFAVQSLQKVVATSSSAATTMRVVRAPGHGVPMFAADSTLMPAIVDWVARVLR